MPDDDFENETNIHKNPDGTYTIRRIMDNVRTTYGRFLTLEDAEKYEDFCKKYNWSRSCQRRQVYLSEQELLQGWLVVE